MGSPVPPPFPEAQAQTVKDWAFRLDMPSAAELVDQIRDWLGHPEKVTAATRKWSPETTGLLIDAGQGLTHASGTVADYWEGRGQQGFDRYAGHLQSVIGSTRVPIDKVAGTLTDSLDSIKEAYKAALQFIADCSVAILEVLKSVPDFVEGFVNRKNPLAFLRGAANAIFSALQGFVNAANNLAKSTLDVLTGYAQTGLKLESAASIVPVPDQATESVGDPDRWKVRPADDYDSPVPDTVAPTQPTEPPRGPGEVPRSPGDQSKPPRDADPLPPGGDTGQPRGGESKPPQDGSGPVAGSQGGALAPPDDSGLGAGGSVRSEREFVPRSG